MLCNVKAKGIIKWILSFVESKKQLNILIYNKALREKLDLNTQIYKDISQRYLVKDKNGIVKIYTKKENELLYEGGFFNNKKNGKGKEFKQNRMIFEGEFKDGKRNGKGKEYNEKGELIFEGEYMNGVRIKGKESYFPVLSKSKYEFEYINKDIKKGKIYEGNMVVFEGELKNYQKWNGHYKGYYNNK